MSDQFFSREEILGGGLSRIRRARAIVFLLEQEARRIGDRNAALASVSPEAAGLFSAILDGDPELMRRSLPGEADAAFIESFRNARRRSKPVIHVGRKEADVIVRILQLAGRPRGGVHEL